MSSFRQPLRSWHGLSPAWCCALIVGVVACGPGAPRATLTPASLPTARPASTPARPPSQPAAVDAPVLVRVPFGRATDQAPESGFVVATGDIIWIERFARRYELVRFDAKSATASTVRLEYPVELIAPGDGTLWTVGPVGSAPGPESYTVGRINGESGQMREVVDVPPSGAWVGLDSIWTVSHAGLRRLHRSTGEVLERWHIPGDRVQVACGAVWISEWADTERLIRLDPATNDTRSFDGAGHVYVIDGECWRVLMDDMEGPVGVERVFPDPPVQQITPAAEHLQYDGKTFWRRPTAQIQAWDLASGDGVGPTYIVDRSDISSYWKIGDDGVVVAAAGRLWLVNGWEIVGYDIPA